MNPTTVNALADYLEQVHRDWQQSCGYTGRPVHRRAYWQNMAARILSDSAKALGEKQLTQTNKKRCK
jgi:hypothetical protein